VVIAITMVLSVFVGVVSVGNENWSMNVETAQNVNGAVTDTQGSFIENASLETKVSQGKEKLKVPEKEGVNVSKDNKRQDVILPGISRNKATGSRKLCKCVLG
jgi:hypothetical protein